MALSQCHFRKLTNEHAFVLFVFAYKSLQRFTANLRVSNTTPHRQTMGHRVQFTCFIIPFLCLFSLLVPSAYSKFLNYNFYDRSCPALQMVVSYNVRQAYRNEPRVVATLLRLHFHDCIANVTVHFFNLHKFLLFSMP